MFVEFPKINVTILVLLIFPIFRTIERFTTPLYITEDNSLFDAFRYFLCRIFAGIFLFIFYKRNKNENKDIIQLESGINNTTRYQNLYLFNLTNNPLSQIKQKKEKKKKIKSFIFLICLCMNILFCFLYRTIFIGKIQDFEYETQSMLIFFDIGFYILLSHFILKQRLYRHHFSSMIVMGLILIILFIMTIKYITIGKKFILSAIYFCFYSFSFSLYDVLLKKYMNDFYKNPYFIMFNVGIINSSLLLIFDTFAYFFNNDISGIIIGFKKNISSALNIFYFILTLIIEFFWVLGIELTVYYFTPCHYSILEYIAEYIYYIKNVISSDEEFYSTGNAIIITIAYLINFFCCLVFNEVVILNFWKLDYNTKIRIQERIIIENDLNANNKAIINQIIEEREDEESVQ